MAADGLQRRLGTGDAIVLGLSSMIGAGVFAVYAPAARVAGTGLMLSLAVAAVIAYANAAASAQLAAVYPTSGGTYVFGRERLGEWWGFTAGWAFVVGKTASCAAMALTFAAYVVPASGWTQRLVALGAVLALGATNYRGITRTARLSRVLVAITLASLAAILIGTWLAPGPLQPLTWSVPGAGPTACCRRPACCSSPSPATPASRPSARRSVTRVAPSPSPSSAPWGSSSSCTPSSGGRRWPPPVRSASPPAVHP